MKLWLPSNLYFAVVRWICHKFLYDFSLFEAESQGVKRMVTQTRVTAEEFDEIAALPENTDKRLEFIGGEIKELVSETYASEIAALVLGKVIAFVTLNKLGRVTGANGGYRVGRDSYIPDVGFISFSPQPTPVRAAYNPLAPDFAGGVGLSTHHC